MANPTDRIGNKLLGAARRLRQQRRDYRLIRAGCIRVEPLTVPQSADNGAELDARDIARVTGGRAIKHQRAEALRQVARENAPTICSEHPGDAHRT
jgi:hypothetical protein